MSNSLPRRWVTLLSLMGPLALALLSAKCTAGVAEGRGARVHPPRAFGGATRPVLLDLAPVSGPGLTSGVGFRLPWTAGMSQYLTQDANDSCCADHVGANKFAFDFAAPDGGAFDV